MKGKTAKKRLFFLHVSVPLALKVAKADRFLVSGIKRIADNAKPKRCKVNTDLVGAPCSWAGFYPAVGAAVANQPKVRYGNFSSTGVYNRAVAGISVRFKL